MNNKPNKQSSMQKILILNDRTNLVFAVLPFFLSIISSLRIFAFEDTDYTPEIVRVSLVTFLSLLYLVFSKIIKRKNSLIFISFGIQLIQIICEIEAIRFNLRKGKSGALGTFFLALCFKLSTLLLLKWQLAFLIKCLTMAYYALRVCKDDSEKVEFCLQGSIFLTVLFIIQYYRWTHKIQKQKFNLETQRNFLKEFIKQNIPGAIVILGINENNTIGLEFANSASEDLLKSSDSYEIIDSLHSFSYKSTCEEKYPTTRKGEPSHRKKLKLDLKRLISESLKSADFKQYTATLARKKKAFDKEGTYLNNKFSPMKVSIMKKPEDLSSIKDIVALEQEPLGDPKPAQKTNGQVVMEISNLQQNISSVNNHILYQTKPILKRIFSIKTCRVPWEGRIAVLFILDEITENVFELDKKADKKNSEEKGNLLASVSHKLYTPLNGIMNSFENIRSLIREGDKELSRHIKFCSRSVHLLYYSIRNIVDLSKNEETRLDFDLSSYKLGPILDDVLYLIRYLAKIKQIELEVNYAEFKDLSLYCDAESLKRVLLNLLDNAIKFTSPRGKVKLIVLIKTEVNKEKNTVSGMKELAFDNNLYFAQFIIEDTGCGIPIDKQRDLFKFTYKENPGSPLSEGVCTGLPLSQKLLMSMLKKEYHGTGLLKVLSFPHISGTRVSFMLPTDKLPLNGSLLSTTNLISLPRSVAYNSSFVCFSKDSAREGFQKTLITEIKQTHKFKVLIVDDDMSNQLVLKNYLSKFGIEYIETADNGQEAIDKVTDAASRQEPFILVLMDLNMPIKNGYQASREITDLQERGEIPEVTIVAVTANIASNDWPACKEAGMKAFLTKPVNKRLFRETLETLIGRRFLQDEK